jgi:hypothetical protein
MVRECIAAQGKSVKVILIGVKRRSFSLVLSEIGGCKDRFFDNLEDCDSLSLF